MAYEKDGKWLWMMDYCRNKKLNPAINWVWQEAEFAYKQRDEIKVNSNDQTAMNVNNDK